MTEFSKFESIFFDVLNDLKHYLNDLVLVGGWIPYIYVKYLWNNPAVKLITTTDIDFGFGETRTNTYPKTIFQKLSTLDYTERHPRMDRIYPVVLYKKGKMPIDFITFPEISTDIIEKFIGKQINVNKIANFDFLLKYRIPLNINHKSQKTTFTIYYPRPSAFLYHKGATFIDRENQQKQSKDLHYIYFILRYAPDIDVIFREAAGYKKEGFFKNISKNLDEYFERISSKGCLMVEKENGPDEYIDNLREDIFERFKTFRETLITE